MLNEWGRIARRGLRLGAAVGAFCLSFADSFAAPTISSVVARSRYPWNGLVDIDVTFTAAGLSAVSFEVKDTQGNTNLNARTFYLGNPEKNVKTLEVQPGTHRFVWDAAADLGAVERIPFAVTAKIREKSFDVNVTGGTGSGSFVQGSSATLTAAAKTGYTFAGWTGATADVGALASAASATTTLTIPSRDVAYTATYTPNTYTVKFNANGGTGTMADESFTYDTAKTLTANAFTRNGFTFKGWADTADATAVKYTDKQSVKNLVATGTKNLYAVWDPRLYMIIDLSAGSNASSYPISYLDAVPSGGFVTTTYRTTKLVLRCADAGSYILGSDQSNTTHKVTLTRPFYIGVFEMTQKQWTLVMGTNPSSSSYGRGDTYPVHDVSYDAIRGSSSGAMWPASSTVDSASFLGKLQARTKLNFDLPTDAQWEYACRAGTTTKYYWGESANNDYFWSTANAGSTAHIVGLKTPNAWGLYDMCGNVWEWCLDWYGPLVYGTDPRGPSSGTERVVSGGSWGTAATGCTSSSWGSNNPTSDNHSSYNRIGFRLSLTIQ